MSKIPLAPIERILRRNGANRVSMDAVEEFALVLEDITGRISEHAAELASHAGRNTVLIEDVKLARRNFRRH